MEEKGKGREAGPHGKFKQKKKKEKKEEKKVKTACSEEDGKNRKNI